VEYALGQLHEGGASEENGHILRVEYENLVQGEVFHKGFEELALEYNMSLPSKLITSYIKYNSHSDCIRVSLQSCRCYSWSLC